MSKYKIYMTKEMIKAIRLVYGLNPDLRIKCKTINKQCLYDWIETNRCGIFGLFAATIPPVPSTDFNEYDRMIWHAVYCVINGHET